MDGQVGTTAGIYLIGQFVPGVLEEIGDDILEMFFVFIRANALEHTGQIGLEKLDLIALEALLEVGFTEGFPG